MVVKKIGDVERLQVADYIKDQIRNAFGEKNNGDRAADSSPDVERAFICEPLGTKKNPRFVNPVRIVIRSTRKRETDHRAISEKALVDALVKNGILADDKKKHINQLAVDEPEIGEDEKTIVIIEEI